MIRNGSFPGGAAVFEESFRGAPITVRLNHDVDHVAVLVHRTPQILLFALDSNEDFVQGANISEPTDVRR